jgi:DNA-binding HxlR family transcriptional regulator
MNQILSFAKGNEPIMNVECDPIFAKVDQLIALLGKSKLLHILLVLHVQKGPLNFSELKRRVDSSSTTVSRRLAELEENNLVERKVNSSKPYTVNYTLTEKASDLAPSIQSMYNWCEINEHV